MPIEVEKKFLLTEAVRAAVTEGAEMMERRVFSDTYYDDAAWSLSTSDTFLRQRDDQWELKVGDPTLAPHGARKVNRYEEITDETEIAKRLSLSNGPLAESVLAKGYEGFVTITTDRQTYRKDGFTIVIDHVTYQGGDTYDVVEIELVGETMEDAEQRILEYAALLGLPDQPVRGKLQEFCERHRPDHIDAMKAAGQLA